MKKILLLPIIVALLLPLSNFAQELAWSSTTMTPSPAVYPGTISVGYIFTWSASSSNPFTMSSDDGSNNYMTLAFSFTKIAPAGPPTGTGADMFTWTSSTAGNSITWTGASKNVQIGAKSGPPSTYPIVFTNAVVTSPATQAQSDIRADGSITPPGTLSSDNPNNNYTVISTYSTTALPVQWLFFNATKVNNNMAGLLWETASEQGNDHFEVERSTDGSSFNTTLGSVKGNGTSLNVTHNYSFIDSTPVAGLNYYRLKQVDIDGKSQYSDTKFVDFSGSAVLLSIYPNPTTDNFYLKGLGVNTAEITIFDHLGQALLKRVVTGSEAIYIGSLSSATYNVLINQNGQKSYQRLVVSR